MMKKVVMPCMVECYDGKLHPAYAQIEYVDGRLSIHGVVGPKRSGNCYGSAGQCVDSIRGGEPAEGWDSEMLEKFCKIWDEWHLNDCRAYCKHQKALGWDKVADEIVPIFHYRLKMVHYQKQRWAERQAIDALKKGVTFTPTEEQTKFAALPYSMDTYQELDGEMADLYEPKKPLFAGDEGPVEYKNKGWLSQDEHPEGILSKPCPVCGFKYGHGWQMEEVPPEVIKWLEDLPDSPSNPAWV